MMKLLPLLLLIVAARATVYKQCTQSYCESTFTGAVNQFFANPTVIPNMTFIHARFTNTLNGRVSLAVVFTHLLTP
jgi:hypothetical protein